MLNWLGVTLICVLLGFSTHIRAAQTPPVPDHPMRAQTSLTYNPTTRCPDLRVADEGTIAVVVFWLPRSGPPTQISVNKQGNSIEPRAMTSQDPTPAAPTAQADSVTVHVCVDE